MRTSLGVGGAESLNTKRFPNRSNAKSVQALPILGLFVCNV
jgi:hypothetical protein